MTTRANLKSKFISAQRGFTLIEILIAMFVMTMGIMVALTGGVNTDENMEKTLNNIERSIRFGADEAALRNVVVRLNFKLNQDPQVFAVEYGPNAQYIPPPLEQTNITELSGQDLEIYEETLEETSRKFNRIRELQEESFEVYYPLKVVGIGLDNSEQLVYDGEASLYIYPSGEKDSAIIILANDNQISTVMIDPYTMDFQRDVWPLQNGPEWNEVLEQSTEIFENWKTRE